MPEPGERRATVRGGGVAALACARLLARDGWAVTLDGAPARRVPVLLLGAPTLELLDSIWGRLDLGGHRLRGRIVRWGSRSAVEVADAAVAVDGAALLGRLQMRHDTTPGGWLVHAEGRTARAGTRVLGRRVVLNAPVALRPGADEGLSSMETVAGGWLFLIPTGDRTAVLQAMVPAPPADPAATLDRLLRSTTDVAARVGDVAGDAVAVIPAAPHATDPLAAPGRIAVGDAARAFDPVSGDGTGQGLRGAALAAAALESIARGMPEPEALEHYAHRLQLAFLRHLAHCMRFYEDVFGASPGWRPELDVLRAELSDPVNRALAARPFAHRLANGRLEPLERAA